jgi:methylmalonyl-CoA mutase N-terminal domain/subunit
MYRGRLWTMRQYAGYSTAEESNRRYRALLAGGTSGLSVAFDLPTQIGFDPDHPLAAGEVGRAGVSIASLADFETLFEGIPLDRVSVSMTINSTAIVLLAMTLAAAARRGVPPHALKGTLQNDMLKEFAARGTYRLPVKPSMRLVTDVIAYASASMPGWNPVSVSGYHIREAGATAVQEVAFTLADVIAYVEEAVRRGLDVDAFAPRLSFFFNAHNHLFEEAAKFRAARRVWARTMKERFRAKDPRSLALRFHAQTAGSTLQASQVDVNVVRVTVQALAAVLGGAQSLHTNGKDEALSLPSEEAAILALRTQQVLAHESGVADVVDPLGGSPFVEALTDEIDRRASDLIARIDAMGGAVAAIEKGWYQREIERSAYEALKRVEAGKDVVVGLNRFADAAGPSAPPPFAIHPESERRAVERVKDLRRARDAKRAASALEALRRALPTDGNLVPPVVSCVESGVTLGEVMQAMEDRFGRYEGR